VVRTIPKERSGVKKTSSQKERLSKNPSTASIAEAVESFFPFAEAVTIRSEHEIAIMTRNATRNLKNVLVKMRRI
jgi:hypothetical protein